MNGYKYNIFSFSLDSAIDEEIIFNGGFVYIKDATDLTVAVTVRPDSRSNDAVTLRKQFGIVVPFRKLFITAAAQAGKTVDILVTDSFDAFRIFEQAQVQDIGTVGTITNPVTSEVSKWGGTELTGRDISADFAAWQKAFDPQYGTQIAKSAVADTATVIIHTVVTGKTLLLEEVAINVNGGVWYLAVRDLTDATVFNIFAGDTAQQNSLAFKILIPAGYDVVVMNSGAYNSRAFIKGREI